MAEYMESLTKKEVFVDTSEYLQVFELIVIEAQKLKVIIAKYCNLEPFKNDEIDRIRKRINKK